MSHMKELPEFENPPVVEVVCGVLFNRLPMQAAHLGVLWEKFKPDYPSCQDVNPLAPIMETFDGSPGVPQEIDLSDVLPRTWFLHKRGVGVVQVQRDRFLHNWKKSKPDDEYPLPVCAGDRSETRDLDKEVEVTVGYEILSDLLT